MMKASWKIGVNAHESRLNGSAPSGAGWSGVGIGVGLALAPLAPGDPAGAPAQADRTSSDEEGEQDEPDPGHARSWEAHLDRSSLRVHRTGS